MHGGDTRRARERAVTACCLAARAWASRTDAPGRAVEQVARLYGVLALQDGPGRHRGLEAFLDGLHGPLAQLLPPALHEPGDAEVVLLDSAGALTEDAAELLSEHLRLDPGRTGLEGGTDSWQRLHAELVEREVFQALRASGNEDAYRAGRRALIDHPSGHRRVLADAFQALGPRVRPDAYEPLRPTAQTGGWWFACPLCHWPMQVRADRVACAFPPHRAGGANYLLRTAGGATPSLVQLGGCPQQGLTVPTASPADEVLAAEFAVWRYIVIPGLVEVQLHDELAAVLLATRDGDPGDPGQAPGTDTIVVPEHRADQLPVLRERLDGVYQVLNHREFAVAVRAATRPVR